MAYESCMYNNIVYKDKAVKYSYVISVITPGNVISTTNEVCFSGLTVKEINEVSTRDDAHSEMDLHF